MTFDKAIVRDTPFSRRQERAMLRYISVFLAAHGYPPTRRELRTSINVQSTSDAQACLERLVAKGLVQVAPGVARGIRITATGMIADTDEM